jgi:hypothetical protein
VTARGSSENLLSNAGFEKHRLPNLITSPSLMFVEGAAEVELRTLPDVTEPAAWTVSDEQSRPVRSGTAVYTGGRSTIDLSRLGPGYYRLDVTLGSGDAASTTSTPLAVLEPLPAAARSADSPFGVAVHLGDGNSMNGALTRAAALAGIAHARTDVYWHEVEKKPGEYAFPQGYDTDLNRLADSGIRPLPLSTYRNPHYDGGKTPSSPAGLAAYAAYTSELLKHYGPLTKDVEVYNEFNINFNDGACGRTPACYYEMLRTTSERVKADHPDATVVGPATSGLSLDWVEELLELGGAKHLDAVSVHPYRQPNAPEGIDDEMAALRKVIRDNNNGRDKPIWLTELGWPTNVGGGTTQLQQADYLVRSQALALGNGVERFYWYELMSSGTDPHEKEHHFGLIQWQPPGVTTALPPKPAYVTQAVTARELAGKKPSGKDGLPEPAYSYRFGDGAETTRVMWAPEARTVSLTADQALTLTDAYGRSSRLTPVSGRIQLDLDSRPVFVEGPVKDVTVVEKPALSLSTPAVAAAGDVLPVTLTVDRTGVASGPVPGRFDLEIEGERTTVRAPKGKVTEVTVDVPAGDVHQERHLTARAGPGSQTMARLTAATDVKAPVTLHAEPVVTSTGPPAGQVEITLTNNQLDSDLPVESIDWQVGPAKGTDTGIDAVPAASSRTVRTPVDSVVPWDSYDQVTTANLPGREPLTVSGTTGFNPVERDGTATVPSIDLASQADWARYTEPWGGPEDLSGAVRLSYTEDELVLKADIVDDTHSQRNPASTLYNGDSIQFAVTPGVPGRTAGMTEIGVALLADGPVAHTYMAFGAAPTGPTPGARTTVTREGDTTSYAVSVPWTSLGFPNRPAGPIGYSVMFNDDDGQGRTGYLEWGSGIGRTKDPGQFRPVQLMN